MITAQGVIKAMLIDFFDFLRKPARTLSSHLLHNPVAGTVGYFLRVVRGGSLAGLGTSRDRSASTNAYAQHRPVGRADIDASFQGRVCLDYRARLLSELESLIRGKVPLRLCLTFRDRAVELLRFLGAPVAAAASLRQHHVFNVCDLSKLISLQFLLHQH